jgi:hypothetical protein
LPLAVWSPIPRAQPKNPGPVPARYGCLGRAIQELADGLIEPSCHTHIIAKGRLS